MNLPMNSLIRSQHSFGETHGLYSSSMRMPVERKESEKGDLILGEGFVEMDPIH